MCDVTGVPESFKGFPAGTRAVQLPDGEFPYPFLRVFGRPPRASACECERDTNTTLHMALMLQGGDFTRFNGTGGKSIYGERFAGTHLNSPHSSIVA